jgi:hypothetical protein
MSLAHAPLAIFNRGIVDPRALARVDVKRVTMSAEQQTNFIPRSIGSMAMRPGMEYIDPTYNNSEARHLPFVFSSSDTAIVEVTDALMRVRVDEAIIQRNSVSSAITNGTFTTDISGWTDADESGATSSWATGGYLSLVGTRFNASIVRQLVTVIAADRNVQHGLKVVIERGPVQLKIGSTAGGTEYVSETTLRTGVYSLAFTPAGDFYIDLSNRNERSARVDSIAIEAGGDMTIAAPWLSNDLENLRWDQSADVIFVACDGYQQRRIERLGARSWGLAKYEPLDGPYRIVNTTTQTMTAGALVGDTTLTSSRSYFQASHVGALFQLLSRGQKVTATATGEGQFTDSIRVVGVGSSRIFDYSITGTWAGTITLQRSFDDETSWTDVTTYTSNSTSTYNDSLDNEIVFYRIGFDTGDYTSGTATLSLTYSGGGLTGHCRVTGYTSATQVSIAILDRIGQTTATNAWSESIWSDYRGWPTSVALYEGRLWWAGNDYIVGSVSDGFDSFDEEVEGDSGVIVRSIGAGPIDFVNWLIPAQRLLIGMSSAELSARSTSQDELLTPTNFNIKAASTQGSMRVQAAKIDSDCVYVQRSERRLYQQKFDLQTNDYVSSDLCELVPEIGDPGITLVAVQRQPDTRVHCLRTDGTVALLVLNQIEEVRAWVIIETDGVVEDLFVMPGDLEDTVYYCVNRTINGVTKRYLERWALESDCVGGEYNEQADCFAMFINGPASATVTGLDHLEGESVVVWADSMCLRDASGDIATFTVSGGSITLTNAGVSYAATRGIVGLPYRARFKSAKLPYGMQLGTSLAQRQRISQIGLILVDTHNQGLKYGRDYDHMSNLPKTVNGTTVDVNQIHSFYDQGMVTYPGATVTDARLCLEANAPRCATITAAVLGIGTHDHPS